MQCHDFEMRLNDVLDDGRNPAADAQLTAHAASCSACRMLLGEQDALFIGLARLPVPSLSGDFAERVVSAAMPVAPGAGARRRTQIWRAVAAVLTSAAAMLLALTVIWSARQARLQVAG